MEAKKKFRVLIVDDSIQVIDSMMDLLKTDYMVMAATNGERAIMLANKEPQPDLILLDVDMPKMDGLEVCRRLKQHSDTSMIPVILLVELDARSTAYNGLELGAVDLFTKPTEPSLLKLRISNHLKLAKLLKSQSTSEPNPNQPIQSQKSKSTATDDKNCNKLQGAPTNQRILVVEDNEIMLTVVQAMLERIGFEVSTATNGQQALDLINQPNRYDVVVTDLNMPIMNGYKLLESLRSLGNSTPVIAMTASDVDLSHEQSIRLGFAGCLLKPFDEHAFIEILKKIGVKLS